MGLGGWGVVEGVCVQKTVLHTGRKAGFENASVARNSLRKPQVGGQVPWVPMLSSRLPSLFDQAS